MIALAAIGLAIKAIQNYINKIDNLKAKVELYKASNIAFSSSYTRSIKLAFSYEFSHDWDVRFLLEIKETTFAVLTLNYYWGF